MIERVVLKSGQVRWRVRYRTPDYRIRSSTFDRRRDAEEFEAETRRTLRLGTFIDPVRGKLTLQALWEEYDRTGTTHLRATTRQNYRAASRHFLAKFGRWPIGKIEHADVADWVVKLSRDKGPSTVRYAHRVLCLVLDHAIRTRRLTVNVARGVRLPRQPPARERILTMAEVDALAVLLGRKVISCWPWPSSACAGRSWLHFASPTST